MDTDKMMSLILGHDSLVDLLNLILDDLMLEC